MLCISATRLLKPVAASPMQCRSRRSCSHRGDRRKGIRDDGPLSLLPGLKAGIRRGIKQKSLPQDREGFR